MLNIIYSKHHTIQIFTNKKITVTKWQPKSQVFILAFPPHGGQYTCVHHACFIWKLCDLDLGGSSFLALYATMPYNLLMLLGLSWQSRQALLISKNCIMCAKMGYAKAMSKLWSYHCFPGFLPCNLMRTYQICWWHYKHALSIKSPHGCSFLRSTDETWYCHSCSSYETGWRHITSAGK